MTPGTASDTGDMPDEPAPGAPVCSAACGCCWTWTCCWGAGAATPVVGRLQAPRPATSSPEAISVLRVFFCLPDIADAPCAGPDRAGRWFLCTGECGPALKAH